jgi:hypothetical protein
MSKDAHSENKTLLKQVLNWIPAALAVAMIAGESTATMSANNTSRWLLPLWTYLFGPLAPRGGISPITSFGRRVTLSATERSASASSTVGEQRWRPLAASFARFGNGPPSWQFPRRLSSHARMKSTKAFCPAEPAHPSM